MLRWVGYRPRKVREAIDGDFDDLFADFLSESDLSFVRFKTLWSERKMTLIHHCCPERANRRHFTQLLFLVLLLRLHCPPTGDELRRFVRLSSLQSPLLKQSAWNIAVIFSLYCAYGTQSCANMVSEMQSKPAAHRKPGGNGNEIAERHPIRITPELFAELSLAVNRISLLARY